MSRIIRTIVAGVASVQQADPILAPAAALAAATGAKLHFVHAYELPDPLLSAYARDGVLGPDFGAGYRDSIRAQLEDRVAALGAQVDVTCHVAAGSASEALSARAEALGADLLVVGATRSGKFLRSILGSTAERVVRAATVPVLVLRAPIRRPIERVLMTTDLSPFSAHVHGRAVALLDELFKGEDPDVRSLLVVWYDLAFPPPLRRDSLEDVARDELGEFLAANPGRGRPIEPRVRIGDPAKEVSAEAIEWDADLVVLGTHSRTGRSRFLLGSVAEATLRATVANTLIIPATPAATGEGAAAEAQEPPAQAQSA